MVLLLVIIYIAFISLGLPDSILGSAWPAMYGGLGVPIASAGVISMILSGGTIISSLFSDTLIRKAGTGMVTFVSVAITAVALMGFSFAGSLTALCLWAIPLGLGAGSVDAALNNFVALHYKARHMNWLHCFWGIGASAGPLIMSWCLVFWNSWRAGYRAISALQFALVLVLLGSLPLWKKARRSADSRSEKTGEKSLSLPQIARLPGAKQALLAFFCYCSIESMIGLWGSSYLVVVRGISADTAARWIALFYIGITLGRFFSGFLSMVLTNRQMITLGQLLIGVGVIILLLPFGGYSLLAGFFLAGTGCAPIYPSMLHETPNNFGAQHSQSIMGVQMACAYIGNTLIPPLFGVLAARAGYRLFPLCLMALLGVMTLMTILLHRKIAASSLSS